MAQKNAKNAARDVAAVNDLYPPFELLEISTFGIAFVAYKRSPWAPKGPKGPEGPPLGAHWVPGPEALRAGEPEKNKERHYGVASPLRCDFAPLKGRGGCAATRS